MKIQINNSFELRLQVLAQGAREPLSSATNVRVVFQCLDSASVRWQAQCLTIADDVIVARVSPTDARSAGRYLVGVFYNIGGAQRYAENATAFTVVRTAAEADAEGESVSADLCVKFAASGKNGLSAFELAVQNGYAGTYEEWLAAGENANIAALRAVKAADAANDAAQAANAASQQATDAAVEANSVASRADAAADEARSAAELATTSAGEAAAAVKAAQTSTALAEGAALEANRAATDAADSAGLADESAVLARDAAAGANAAAQAANAASQQATDASIEANSAASKANTAAVGIGDRFAAERAQLENGEVVVGLARELYSRGGVVESSIFTRRQAPGGTAVSDTRATLMRIGGNLVKNDIGSESSMWVPAAATASLTQDGDTLLISATGTRDFVQISYKGMLDTDFLRAGNKYYYSCEVKKGAGGDLLFGVGNNGMKAVLSAARGADTTTWQRLSLVVSAAPQGYYLGCTLYAKIESFSSPVVARKFLCINLTEMFGPGKEPGKEECDAIFGAMKPVPIGITAATVSRLEAVGYNQFSAADVISDTTIEDGSLVAAEGSSLAVVECLPGCSYGVAFGDGCAYSAADVRVFFSPKAPVSTASEMYIDELGADETTGAFTPNVAGYLLISSPTLETLCVYIKEPDSPFAYESYSRSVAAIPALDGEELCAIVGGEKDFVDTVNYSCETLVRHIGVTAVSSLSWQYNASYGVLYAPVPGMYIQQSYGTISSVRVAGYDSAKPTTIATLEDKCVMVSVGGATSYIYIRDTSYGGKDDFLRALAATKIYYALATPQLLSVATGESSYMSSSSGVEGFTSRIPLRAEIRRMRAIGSEARSFFDRLIQRLGVSDVTAAADMIVSAIQSQQEITNVEESEV